MNQNPLAVAADGYLCPGPFLPLSIVSRGYLCFLVVVEQPRIDLTPEIVGGTDYRALEKMRDRDREPLVLRPLDDTEHAHRAQQLREDEEVMAIFMMAIVYRILD